MKHKIVVYTYKQDTHNIIDASEKTFIIRQDIFILKKSIYTCGLILNLSTKNKFCRKEKKKRKKDKFEEKLMFTVNFNLIQSVMN